MRVSGARGGRRPRAGGRAHESSRTCGCAALAHWAGGARRRRPRCQRAPREREWSLLFARLCFELSKSLMIRLFPGAVIPCFRWSVGQSPRGEVATAAAPPLKLEARARGGKARALWVSRDTMDTAHCSARGARGLVGGERPRRRARAGALGRRRRRRAAWRRAGPRGRMYARPALASVCACVFLWVPLARLVFSSRALQAPASAACL